MASIVFDEVWKTFDDGTEAVRALCGRRDGPGRRMVHHYANSA